MGPIKINLLKYEAMKIVILTLCLTLTSTFVFSQKKTKEDPKDLKIDTLTNVNKALTIKLDSVTIRLDSVLKEMVK